MTSPPSVTAVLLNFRRPDNVGVVIDSIRSQTVPVSIVLWNNGEPREFSGADWVIQSERNVGCLVRWHLAAMAESEYVFCLDDDLCFDERDVIERCIIRSRQQGDRRIIGRTGRTVGPAPRYYRNGGNGDRSVDHDGFVDIVKGRFMFLPRELLNGVPIAFPRYQGRGDDIWISLHTAQKRRWHMLPKELSTGFRELPDLGVGLAKNRDHYLKRDMVIANMIQDGMVRWQRRGIRSLCSGVLLRHVIRAKGYVDHRDTTANGKMDQSGPSRSIGLGSHGPDQ